MDNYLVDRWSLNGQLDDIHWYRLRSRFQAKKDSHILKGHIVSVFQAVVKAVSCKIPTFSSLENADLPIFHIVGQKHTFKMTKGEIITLDFLFFRKKANDIKNWAEGLYTYFNETPNNRTLELLEPGEIEERNFNTLDRELKNTPDSGEICLEFSMPLPFQRQPQKNGIYISKKEFVTLFENRIENLFGKKISYNPKDDDFKVIPHFLSYRQIKHLSKSQPGTYQLISGVVGKLYLKGSWPNFMQFIVLCSEIHLGSKRSNSQGYYLLHSPPQPNFKATFPQKAAILKVVGDILDRYDQAYRSQAKEESHPFEISAFADAIYHELMEESYTPTPLLPTGQMTLKDLVVSQYLRKIIYKYTGFFEDWDLVKKIVKDKLIEAIEDFFPKADKLIIDLLKKIILNNYITKDQTQPQTQCINIENPLTPCLAGLYYQNQKKANHHQAPLIITNPGISLSLYGDWLEIGNGAGPRKSMHLDSVREIEVPGSCKISANVLKACKERGIALSTRLGSGYTVPIIDAITHDKNQS